MRAHLLSRIVSALPVLLRFEAAHAPQLALMIIGCQRLRFAPPSVDNTPALRACIVSEL